MHLFYDYIAVVYRESLLFLFSRVPNVQVSDTTEV